MSEPISVRNNSFLHRFEAEIDSYTAFLTYLRKPNSIVLVHTEVPSELEGRGVGGALARAALDYARSDGLKVIPQCPFVAAYIKRHPEQQDLVRG